MIAFTVQPITELRESMSFSDYCDFPGLNQSRLKRFDYDLGGCPELYRHDCTHPDDRRNSDALETGRRYHHFLLEPDSFDAEYAVMTPEVERMLLAETLDADPKSKVKKFSRSLGSYERWEAARLAEGRAVVTVSEAAQLNCMAEAVRRSAEVMDALNNGLARTEVSAFCGYKLPSGTAFQLKARFDLVPGGDALIDLKTCRTADSRKFAAQVYDLGYDLQAAFYLDAARRSGLKVSRFGFLAQDKFPPYLPCIHWMPDDWLKYGRVRYQKCLLDVAECIKTNKWPGRKSGELEPPRWAQAEIEAVAG